MEETSPWEQTLHFWESLLDSLKDHLVVIDEQGRIHYVNAAWLQFADQNGLAQFGEWIGANYLECCDQAAKRGERCGALAAAGVRRVIAGGRQSFELEYPCHSQEQKRWFLMRAMPLRWQGPRRYVIAHQNITVQKLAEQKVKVLSLQDELTGIANRRHFNQFLAREWKRAMRRGIPMSLLMLDIDYFKEFNDHFGHQQGDQALQQVAKALSNFGKRGGDLVARYGGEEFAVVLADTAPVQAELLAEAIRVAVYRLNIVHDFSKVDSRLTVSVGVATMVPAVGMHKNLLIRAADNALYVAKSKGRNRVIAASPDRHEAWWIRRDRKPTDTLG